ncbi:hypothetical protein ACAG39_07585 [Caldicellulosiruptoraceae bacterium PP1]
MKCIDEGELQAYIDNQVTFFEKILIKLHLLFCKNCSERYKEIKNLNLFMEAKMSFGNNKEIGGINNMNKFRKPIAATVASILVLVILIFTPAGKALSDALNIFRVSNISTINLTNNDINTIVNKINEVGEKNIDLKQYGKIEVENEGNQEIQSLSQMATLEAENNFKVKIPNLEGKYNDFYLTSGYFEKSKKLTFTLNVDTVNDLLSTLGAGKLLPQELNNKTFKVKLNNSIYLNFTKTNSDNSQIYFSYMQVKSPELTLPENVDANEIKDVLLSLPFIPENIKTQINAIKDYKHTLPIPVLKDTQTTQEVNVNGQNGILIEDNKTSDKVLIWVDSDNNIYTINSSNLSKEDIINLAYSVK